MNGSGAVPVLFATNGRAAPFCSFHFSPASFAVIDDCISPSRLLSQFEARAISKRQSLVSTTRRAALSCPFEHPYRTWRP